MADQRSPPAQPLLLRHLSPSLVGPDVLENLLADVQLRELLATTVFTRALPAGVQEGVGSLEWPAVRTLTATVCAQMELAAPPDEKLFVVFQKLADASEVMSLAQFLKFFKVLLQQVQQARCLPARAPEGVDKPPLQPQLAMMMELLGATPPYQAVIGSGQLAYDALASITAGAAQVLGDDNWLDGEDARGEALGWDAWGSGGMVISEDSLTAAKAAQVNGWAGAIGTIMTEGVRHFSMRVWQPVDDAFFVGVCAPDVDLFAEPKRNEKAVLWSGGSASRPGTVRLFGEKLRQMATFVDGDVIGVTIDFNSGGVSFYKNGVMQFRFNSACRGPLCPFFSVKHSGPAATLLPWNGREAAASADGCSATLDEELCSSRLIEVDGSMLEGGGQVLRVALGCAALLRVPLQIHSIRSSRPSPGLGAQHTTGAKLVADCCNGLLSPDTLNGGTHCTGVTSLKMWPSVCGVRGGSFVADTRSAGATTLLLQAVLPCCLLGAPDATTRLVLRGGTNVRWSPPIDHTRMALLPLLYRMGVHDGSVSIDLHRRGFYPQGGGEVVVSVDSVNWLLPLTLQTRGDPVSVRALVFARGVARPLAKELMESTRALLRSSQTFGEAELIIDLDVEDARVIGDDPPPAAGVTEASFDDGCGPLTRKQRRALHMERQAYNFGACGVQLVVFGSLGGVISADSLAVEDFKHAPSLAVKALEEQWAAGGAVDEHLMDQLVLYMAMATGRSHVVCNGPTSISSLHLETATALTTQITGVPFSLSPCEGAGGTTCIRVECDGLAWRNELRWQGHVLGITVEHGVVLTLTCDEAWERECLKTLSNEGIIRNERGERTRHVTLLSMRALWGEARHHCSVMRDKLAVLPLPPVNFHPDAGTATRATGRSVFYALRGQSRWRKLAEEIAAMLGVDAPQKERLFHMSVWNDQNGDPFRSVGDVQMRDFSDAEGLD